MAVFNKDKPDYLDDPKMPNDFDSLRYYNRESGPDQYQMQNGYGGGGYNGGQSSMQQRQMASQQQMQSMGRGQNDYSLMSLGGAKVPNQGFNQPGYQQNSRGGPGGQQNGALFDSSSFPSLGGSSAQGTSRGNLSGYGTAAMYGSGAGQIRGDEDFTIEKEDFPALPGSQKHSDSGSAAIHNLAGRDLGLVGGGVSGAAGNIGNSTHSQIGGAQSSTSSQGQGQGEYVGGAFANVGTPGFERAGGLNISGLISNSPKTTMQGGSAVGASSQSDARFGLGGLLDIMLMGKDLNALALGTDLTGFGLNLNSGESLFPTFASPFTDQALTPDPQFHTPSCYMMHPPSLKGEHLSKFQLETLFYMFYSMPKDVLQACAAQELYRREWRFHGELKVWLKPRTPHELMQSHPSVMFVFFDVAAWETRLFTTARGPSVGQALLSEEEVRVKLAPPTASS